MREGNLFQSYASVCPDVTTADMFTWRPPSHPRPWPPFTNHTDALPRHVQTCLSWISLFMDTPPDRLDSGRLIFDWKTFLFHGYFEPKQTESKMARLVHLIKQFNKWLPFLNHSGTSPDMFKLVQPRPHHWVTPTPSTS